MGAPPMFRGDVGLQEDDRRLDFRVQKEQVWVQSALQDIAWKLANLLASLAATGGGCYQKYLVV